MKSSDTKGFTLIELIVVTVIIAIFASISLSTINRFTNEKQLQNETKKMMIVLELAKSKTNSGDITLCGTDPGIAPEVQDFTFEVEPSKNSYKIVPNCIVGDPTPIFYNVGSGIEIEQKSITFSQIYGKVNCSCFTVTSNLLSKCRYVKVSENTVIDEGACTDANCSTCTNCTCP